MAFDTALAANEYDPWIGINDGTHFNGFAIDDLAYTAPIDGESGNKYVNVPRYSGQIKMQFKLSDSWGFPNDNVHTTIGNYQNSFDLTKGLYLKN